jgi:hypothetical protein
MNLRSCSQCGSPAALSLCQLLSTVAVTPRKQKCGIAVPYCVACIQRLAELLDLSGLLPLQKLSQSLYVAYTALTDSAVKPFVPSEEVSQ